MCNSSGTVHVAPRGPPGTSCECMATLQREKWLLPIISNNILPVSWTLPCKHMGYKRWCALMEEVAGSLGSRAERHIFHCWLNITGSSRALSSWQSTQLLSAAHLTPQNVQHRPSSQPAPSKLPCFTLAKLQFKVIPKHVFTTSALSCRQNFCTKNSLAW